MAGWNTRISISSTTVPPSRCPSKRSRYNSHLSKPGIHAILVSYVRECLAITMGPLVASKICLIRGFLRTIGWTCGTRPIISINRSTAAWTGWVVTGRRPRAPVWATWDTHRPRTDIRPLLLSMRVASFKRPRSIIRVAYSMDRTARHWSSRRCTTKCIRNILTCSRNSHNISSSSSSINIFRRSSSTWCTNSNSKRRRRRNNLSLACIRNNNSNLSNTKGWSRRRLVSNSRPLLKVRPLPTYQVRSTRGWEVNSVRKCLLLVVRYKFADVSDGYDITSYCDNVRCAVSRIWSPLKYTKLF